MIGGTLSASAAATLAGSSSDATQNPGVTDVPESPLARLRSAIGASLIGFARIGDGRSAGTVQRKLSELPSIVDFGAVGDDRTDNTDAIQRAIDTIATQGGGLLLVPAGIFQIRHALILRTNVRLTGVGSAAVLHLVNTDRSSAIRGDGTRNQRLYGISIRDLTVAGDVRFSGGVPSVVNGSGITLVHADDCDVTGVQVIGFSDGGINFHNGSHNSIANCRVERTAQGICFTASDVNVTGNIALGNRISDTGQYNGLHLEGGFGGEKMNGQVSHTTLSGNTITTSWEAGINIELAPHTSCVGNTVHQSGMGRTVIAMGIKVYGGAYSALCGNTVTGSSGDAIVIGANSGRCSVEGNTTADNGGALLLTDSGAQVTNDVAIGINNFTEGDVRTQGNVRIRNRTTGFSFANRTDPDPQVLDWYQEGRFTPRPTGPNAAGYTVRDARFTRIGNVVHVAIHLTGPGEGAPRPIAIGGLPASASMASHLPVAYRSGAHSGEMSAALTAGQTVLVLSSPARVEERIKNARQVKWEVTITGSYLTND
ncbi:glycosyl hydrolase family 28-related protein (plasmid) [Sphingomonas pseudosanguinis]|uniref:glycosyl hydrolase family 28-related protein n=1 Tax=Sphingomonas pseudosanguinis TaxID=413712 RepID=UPI003F862035